MRLAGDVARIQQQVGQDVARTADGLPANRSRAVFTPTRQARSEMWAVGELLSLPSWSWCVYPAARSYTASQSISRQKGMSAKGQEGDEDWAEGERLRVPK